MIGWLALVAMAGATAAALVAPWPVAAAALALGVAVMSRRRSFLLFLAVALPLNVAIAHVALPPDGWLRGLVAGIRLGAALAMNLALLSRWGAERLVEDLRLPPRATALLAAIVLAAHDLGADLARLRDARRLEGSWPKGRLARAREAARLIPALVVAAHRRALVRRDALQLAGHATPDWFVPFVAVAALCAAGRMALLALPNVALTYVVAFLGGVLFGPRVAAAGAFVGMAITDLMLTGLYPPGFVNAPAMALVALAGAMVPRRAAIDPALAGAIGIVATFAFSVVADAFTWLLLYADAPEALPPMVLAGLVFNVIPALVNGALFAASAGPTVRAFRAWQARSPQGPGAPGAASRAPAAAPAE